MTASKNFATIGYCIPSTAANGAEEPGSLPVKTAIRPVRVDRVALFLLFLATTLVERQCIVWK